MGRPKKARERREYAEWLAMSDVERKRESLPTSRNKMALYLGLNPRTLIRWEDEHEIKEFVKQATMRRAAPGLAGEGSESRIGPPRGQTSRDSDMVKLEAMFRDELVDKDIDTDGARQEYLTIRKRIFEAASRTPPDMQAAKQYMDIWGRRFIEDENEDPFLLAGMSDDDLVDEFVRMVGVEEVAAALARGGA